MNRKPISWDKTTYVHEEWHEGACGPFPGPPRAGYAQPLTESENGCPRARWRQKASSKGSGRSAIQGRGRKWWGMLYKLPGEFSQEQEGGKDMWDRARVEGMRTSNRLGNLLCT